MCWLSLQLSPCIPLRTRYVGRMIFAAHVAFLSGHGGQTNIFHQNICWKLAGRGGGTKFKVLLWSKHQIPLGLLQLFGVHTGIIIFFVLFQCFLTVCTRIPADMFNCVCKGVIMGDRVLFFVLECVFFETWFELEIFEMSHNHKMVVFAGTSKMKQVIYV